ncbi:MAG: hypothetical protein COU51_04740 [Parcubacteria group bacterium CG10_big_fil_rev_8_21_14_0_10_36_14]|nr:MAG: hypothetical protein COU51_04740 [Parcubacteria group bacterium CG10_big_fil_rev_8_21_14_0_10_36_14]
MVWYLLSALGGLILGFSVGRWHKDRESAEMISTEMPSIIGTRKTLKQKIEKNKAEADLLLKRVDLEEKND